MYTRRFYDKLYYLCESPKCSVNFDCIVYPILSSPILYVIRSLSSYLCNEHKI